MKCTNLYLFQRRPWALQCGWWSEFFKAESICNWGLFQYDLCYNYFCIYAPLAPPFLLPLLICKICSYNCEASLLWWGRGHKPFHAGGSCDSAHATLNFKPSSFVIALSIKLPAPCPFSLLTCPFPLSQIFLESCLIGALLCLPFLDCHPVNLMQ